MSEVFDHTSNKIGWGKLSFISMVAIGFIYIAVKSMKRDSDSQYIKGISLGVTQGNKGQSFLDYTFKVGDSTYRGNVTDGFWDQCQNCCVKGNAVIVKYENSDPSNNELVKDIPQGVHLN